MRHDGGGGVMFFQVGPPFRPVLGFAGFETLLQILQYERPGLGEIGPGFGPLAAFSPTDMA